MRGLVLDPGYAADSVTWALRGTTCWAHRQTMDTPNDLASNSMLQRVERARREKNDQGFRRPLGGRGT